MRQRTGCKDVPVNNLMVRSQLACSFRVLELPIPGRRPIGWPKAY